MTRNLLVLEHQRLEKKIEPHSVELDDKAKDEGSLHDTHEHWRCKSLGTHVARRVPEMDTQVPRKLRVPMPRRSSRSQI